MVVVPQITVLVQGPWFTWLLARGDEVVDMMRTVAECLAVGAQVGGAVLGNGHDGCCQLEPGGGRWLSRQVNRHAKPVFLLVEFPEGCFCFADRVLV